MKTRSKIVISSLKKRGQQLKYHTGHYNIETKIQTKIIPIKKMKSFLWEIIYLGFPGRPLCSPRCQWNRWVFKTAKTLCCL